MSNGLLGMDVSASRALASTVADWSGRSDEIRLVITEAEMLSDLPIGVAGLLDEIGSDGALMAAAIRRAADALESFTLQLDSPRTLAAAVASVHAFRGSENDPELDRRVHVLHEMVAAGLGSDSQAAHVVSMLIAANQSVHVAGRDVEEVAAAMAAVDRWNQAEVLGAISSNDQRIDRATAALRSALSPHAASTAQLDDLMAAFLADRNNTDPATLIASVITGSATNVVEFAHANGLDYDIAAGVLDMHKIDRLTTAVHAAPPPEVDELVRQRTDLFRGLVGTDNVSVVGSLSRLVDGGMSARRALAAQHSEQIRSQQIDQVRELFDLAVSDAEHQLDELTQTANALVASNWDVEDAVVATNMAALGNFEMTQIEGFARNEGLSLVDGAVWFAEARSLAMTPDEYGAYQGFVEHFDVLDTASGGEADGLVSLRDLAIIVNNPPEDVELLAAAHAMINAPSVRNRLDSATIQGDIVGDQSFGVDRPQDHKISVADIEAFQAKQGVNFLLGEHLDMIDVASQGGDLSLVDGTLSEQDFQMVLAHAHELNLSESEIAAVELVIDADWYDKTFWQENSDTIMLATAIVAGSVLFVASGGLAGTVSATLIATAVATGGGAALGAGITVLENTATGDEWDQDLRRNTTLGAIGGLAGAGFRGIPAEWAESSVAAKIVTLTGAGADVAGLTAAGLFDPALRQVGDDVDIAEWKADAAVINYVAGGAAVLGAAGAATASNFRAAAMQNAARAGDVDRIAHLVNQADELTDLSVIGMGQRATGALIDIGTAIADDSTAEKTGIDAGQPAGG